MSGEPTTQTCLIPGCENTEIRARGQCDSCYQTAARRVRLGETTWEELEEKGYALPARRGTPLTNPASIAILGNQNTKSTD